MACAMKANVAGGPACLPSTRREGERFKVLRSGPKAMVVFSAPTQSRDERVEA